MIPAAYNLYIEVDVFVITPLGKESESIIIDRLTEIVTLQSDIKSELKSEPHRIFGIWGMIRLISGHFLIVIKDIKHIGKLNNHDIFEIVESQVIPLARSQRHINDVQIVLEKEYLQMLDTVLSSDGFYFSTTMDLTHSFQRLQDASPDFYQMSLFERADERFVWNHNLLTNFNQVPQLQKYALPIMHGFIGSLSNQVSRLSSPFHIWVISRRSVHRAGTRYYSRGCDSTGNASNFVETEQILVMDSNILSFVQTRGSIPLIWSQLPNLYYKPNPKLEIDEDEQINVLREHFNSQIYLHKYGPQIVVNLLNQNGSEKPLGSQFARTVNDCTLKNVKYVPFDFHQMCRNMRWDKLDILMETLETDMSDIRYLHIKTNDKTTTKQVLARQNGVFRTNCIDCLDRTNVVQSMLAWCVLEKMLTELSVLSSTSSPTGQTQGTLLAQTCPEAHFQYKNLWADNGDALAQQYTGTGALKSDFTRTGKRTGAGLIADGYKSSIRYVLNNFRDGFRQDSMDLLLGNYVVDSVEGASASRASPLQRARTMKYRILPWAVLLSLCMLVLRVLFPSEEWSTQSFQLLTWLSLLVLCLSVIFNSGTEFVDSPRLKKLDE